MKSLQFRSDAPVFEAAASLFEQTREQLQKLLPWAEIHHVGATAVPGSLTKGDLDVAVRVPGDRHKVSETILEGLFDRNVGSERTKDFSAFDKKNSDPPLGVQLVSMGSEYDSFHTWVERLAKDPALLKAYNLLKRDYSGGDDMEAYRRAKTLFIRTHLQSSTCGEF